jgi:hypothetical protein
MHAMGMYHIHACYEERHTGRLHRIGVAQGRSSFQTATACKNNVLAVWGGWVCTSTSLGVGNSQASTVTMGYHYGYPHVIAGIRAQTVVCLVHAHHVDAGGWLAAVTSSQSGVGRAILSIGCQCFPGTCIGTLLLPISAGCGTCHDAGSLLMAKYKVDCGLCDCKASFRGTQLESCGFPWRTCGGFRGNWSVSSCTRHDAVCCGMS